METSLIKKNALITGAGKGIGRAVATAFAKEGMNLGLIARSQETLEAAAHELHAEYGVDIFTASADVSERTQVDHAVAELTAQLGHIDVLINNAGIASFGTIVDMPPEEWERMIHVNLLGTYYVTRAVLPAMIAQDRGNIINISSTAGERASATTSAYSASKFAVMGFTESLMQEVRKHNIRVTALAPSTVNTPLAVHAGLKIGEEEYMMQPEDVAQVIVDLLKLPQRIFVKQANLWMTNPR